MGDHNWRNHWDRSDDNRFERHSDCPHHHTSYQDDEPYGHPGWERSDIREDRGWNDPPDRNFRNDFRNDFGDGSLDPSDTHDGSMQPHESGFLGWDASAWEDAGGFEAVLFGHLSNGLGHAGGFSPIIVFAIEDLNVNFNTLNQITQVQNNLVFLNASNGGTIEVAGDVNASGFQSASVEHSTGLMNIPDFA
jgi:hypothetical protein